MINTAEALHIIALQTLEYNTSIEIPLSDSLHYITASDLNAPINIPSFDNAAMDGYCLNYLDWDYPFSAVDYVIKAGDTTIIELQKNQIARIFTGAKIPLNANVVVKQEDVVIQGDRIILPAAFKIGDHIRKSASQTQKGALILKKNTPITAGIISFLATFGISKIKVFTKPRIGIIVIGDELQEHNTVLQEGKIYDSNSIALAVLLKEIHHEAIVIKKVKDHFETLKRNLLEIIPSLDVLLIAGGISVGDYDYTYKALQEIGTQEFFYKLRQKPGKPLFFGKKENCFIFGLPGNPAAVFSCFHIYVKSLLVPQNRIILKAKLTHSYSKNNNLTHWLKAIYNSKTNTVAITENQLSYQMDAFVRANCLVKIPHDITEIEKNDLVSVILF